MKRLKLDHHFAQLVLNGTLTSTWRLFDDKDLRVNDNVLFIDKVVASDPNSWKIIGSGIIESIFERRLRDITIDEMHEQGFTSKDQMVVVFKGYYGTNINDDTPLKVINFRFTPGKPKQLDQEVVVRSDKVFIYADGGSRGNPGPSACGFVLYDAQQNMILNKGMYIGITTNNQAEYMGLKMALEEAKNIGASNVHVYMDSMLVINQMRGIYKVKNRDLWPIHDAIKTLCQTFSSVSFTQIPRESNKIADAAVNTALDHHLHP